MYRAVFYCPLFLLFLGVTGCGREKLVDVAGTVIMDGKPLEDGAIDFDRENGQPPLEVPIQNGHFSLKCPPRTYTVRIFAWMPAKVAENDPGALTSSRKNILPQRFNDQSTIKQEVADSGKVDLEFKVSAK